MSYPSNTRMPPGMAGVQAAGVPGMTGMTAVPAGGMSSVQGMARVPGLYTAEKQSQGLYATPHLYQSLSPAQQGYLAAQVSSATVQQGYLQAQPGGAAYLSASSPASQQRYMVSPTYPGASPLVSSASVLTGAPGYSLPAGAGYSLTAQPSAGVAGVSTALSSQTPTGYPTYINSTFGPVQMSPSQHPYATVTGHPLYQPSPYAGLQVQQTQQVPQGQVPTQMNGRVPAGYSGLPPLGYPYTY